MINAEVRQCAEKYLCCGMVKENTNGYHFTVDDGKYYTCTRFGQTIHLYGKRDGHFPFHAVLGPDWPVVAMVYALIIGVNTIVLGGVYQLGYLVTIIGVTGALVLLIAYSCTALSDPGTIFKKPPPLPSPSTAIVTTQPSDAALNNHNLSHSQHNINDSNNSSSIDDNNGNNNSSSNSKSSDNSNNEGKGDDTKENSQQSADIESAMSSSEVAQPSDNSSDNSKATVFPETVTITGNEGANSVATSRPEPGSMIAMPVGWDNVQTLKIPDTIECGHCELGRPYSARHCGYCKYCVDELDHHCPWCGKCIGENNIECFNFFLTTLCFQSYFLVGVVIYYIIFAVDPKTPSGPSY